MAVPTLTFSTTGSKISSVEGHDHITVTFTANGPYKSFECRATKSGESWGVGIGTLIASFSQTPANTSRSFDIYDDYLVRGDGEYRISLFAQDMNGSWYILTPLFEFQFSNESLNENLIEFGDSSPRMYNTTNWDANKDGEVWTLNSLSSTTVSNSEDEEEKIVLKQGKINKCQKARFSYMETYLLQNVCQVVTSD